MVARLSRTCHQARTYSPSRISRPIRKQAAKGVENPERPPVAAAAHPATAAVSASSAIRNSTSSVSKRLA